MPTAPVFTPTTMNGGYEYTYNIYWEPDGSQLYISFSNGEQWDYQWAVTGTTLYLADLDTGSQLTFQMY